MDMEMVRTALARERFDEFRRAMEEKFFRIADEKERSLEPWNDFDPEEMAGRLSGEYGEWKESYDPEELIDIANFCMFTYFSMQKWKETPDGDDYKPEEGD